MFFSGPADLRTTGKESLAGQIIQGLTVAKGGRLRLALLDSKSRGRNRMVPNSFGGFWRGVKIGAWGRLGQEPARNKPIEQGLWLAMDPGESHRLGISILFR